MQPHAIEALERRALLAVTTMTVDDTLYAFGDAADDHIEAWRDGDDYVVGRQLGRVALQYARVPVDRLDKLVVLAGAGDDTVLLRPSFDADVDVMGGPGRDAITGGGTGGTSRLWGHGNLAGDPRHGPASDDHAADSIAGGAGLDLIYGQGGDDVLTVNANSVRVGDVVRGGDGDDTFDLLFPRVSGGATHDLRGEAGDDVFSVVGLGHFTADGGHGYDTATYADWPAGGGGFDIFLNSDRAGGDRAIFGEVNIWRRNFEAAVGGARNDSIVGSAAAEKLDGGAGDDTLRGGGGNDVLYGRAGRDLMFGDDGNDFLFGGDDDDTLRGGNGDDWLYGQGGRDDLDGGPGFDREYA